MPLDLGHHIDYPALQNDREVTTTLFLAIRQWSQVLVAGPDLCLGSLFLFAAADG